MENELLDEPEPGPSKTKRHRKQNYVDFFSDIEDFSSDDNVEDPSFDYVSERRKLDEINLNKRRLSGSCFYIIFLTDKATSFK